MLGSRGSGDRMSSFESCLHALEHCPTASSLQGTVVWPGQCVLRLYPPEPDLMGAANGILLKEKRCFGTQTCGFRTPSPTRSSPGPNPNQQPHKQPGPPGRDALEGKAPQRRDQQRLGRGLEEVAKAVGGVTVGYQCH